MTQIKRHFLFPFPSNGKAYPKSGCETVQESADLEFPFPSNGKAYPKGQLDRTELPKHLSFHSLQTGKRIQRIRDHGRRNDW